MSTDLTLLVWAIALTLVQCVIAVIGAQSRVARWHSPVIETTCPRSAAGPIAPPARTVTCWKALYYLQLLCWWRKSPARPTE